MKFKLEPAKNQKFELGRTINLAKCDCEKCDFMHCPKNNYALKMVQHKYTVEEFFNENKETLMQKKCLQEALDYDIICDFMDACVGGFPKGTYWRTDGCNCVTSIYLCTQNRSKYGEDFIDKAKIRLDLPTFDVYCFSQCTDGQEKLAKKIQLLLLQLQDLFDAEYLKDSNIGWLDRTGRLYKCRPWGHIKLAEKLGYNETLLENHGWCKIFSKHNYYCLTKLSVEQLNWLIANGYKNND